MKYAITTSRRRPWRQVFLACVAAAVLLAGVQARAQGSDALRIVPLVRDEHVLVSFTLTNGFTEEVRAAIRSGLKTTFTYQVQLRLDVPTWIDRTIGTATTTSSVEYDNLTRRYSLSRILDGRTEETRVTEDESAVRQWLIAQQRLPLFRTSLLQANRDYYVRVQATARPSNGSVLWPFSAGTSAQAKFTFVR
jgi:hypothetical protein